MTKREWYLGAHQLLVNIGEDLTLRHCNRVGYSMPKDGKEPRFRLLV